VLTGDLNLPNGGLFSRFSGLYIPILDASFNGPAPTDTQFDTVEINRQYDGLADFPLYPLNVIADLNAVLGMVYVHLYDLDVSLPADPRKTSPAYQGKYGDTSYYFFEAQDLPLFGPLRTLGVPEPVIDVVEPFFRVLVELGYDRSIPPWEPTPARLIPTLNPVTVATDLANAIGEGINNALALIGSPPLLSIPAPVTTTAGAATTASTPTNGATASADTHTAATTGGTGAATTGNGAAADVGQTPAQAADGLATAANAPANATNALENAATVAPPQATGGLATATGATTSAANTATTTAPTTVMVNGNKVSPAKVGGNGTNAAQRALDALGTVENQLQTTLGRVPAGITNAIDRVTSAGPKKDASTSAGATSGGDGS
jgi:hypothetical protein